MTKEKQKIKQQQPRTNDDEINVNDLNLSSIPLGVDHSDRYASRADHLTSHDDKKDHGCKFESKNLLKMIRKTIQK